MRRLEERLNALFGELEKHQAESEERGKTLVRLENYLGEQEKKEGEVEKLDELDLRFSKELKQLQIQLS